MGKPFARPVAKIADRLRGGRRVEAPAKVLSTDEAHDFYVDDVGRRLIGVSGEALGDYLGAGGIGNDFE